MIQAKPKLLFFVAVDWFFCSHFLGRALAAQDAGYEVLILTNVDRYGDKIQSHGFKLLPLSISRRSLNPLAAIVTLFEIIKIYRKEQPDIIHHVALKPILLGTLAALICGRRKIVNAVVGVGYAFTSQKLAVKMIRPILTTGLRILLNPRGSCVVFENQDDLGGFVKDKLVRHEDAVLIRGAGLDPSLYYPSAIAQEPPVVVLAARLLWDKGIGEFVKAATYLRQRGLKARFVVVGGADLENRACIDAATIEGWKGGGIVELWGFRTDIPQVLGNAAIACLPSYREGLPKSLLEAMACSLPCVTTDVPGCREAVRHEDNGLLVPARDAEALADAIERLLRDPVLAKRMGQRGRERVEQEFSAEYVNAETLGLYRQMLNK